jgi:replicative superfamily II helicase
VATTTLAIGMNLPAKNVLLDGRRWKMLRQYGRWSLEDLAKSEYENMSGRAGRLSLTNDFGRSILVTASRFEADAWLRCYIGREFEAIAPTLKDAPLEDHVLDVVASGLGRSRAQIVDLLLASFTGRVHWKDAMGRERFVEAVDDALTLCREGGLVRDVDDGRLALTHLGRACAGKGLGVRTSAKMALWASESRDAAISDIEIITLLGHTVAGGDVYVALSRPEERRAGYRAEVLARARALGVDGRPIFRSFAEDRWAAEYEESKAHKKTTILLEWIAETPTKEVEQRHQVWAGAIARIGEEYGWLAEALSEICRASNWPNEDADRLRILAGRLTFGVEADALPLMRLRVPRLGRAIASRLRRAGFLELEQAKQASSDDLRKAIGRKQVVEALWTRLNDEAPSVESGMRPRAVGAGFTMRDADLPDSALLPTSTEPANDSAPILLVDLAASRVVYRGIDIPTRPPNHLQRQTLFFLAALATRPGTIMSDTDLADTAAKLGGGVRRPVAPDLKDLRYKIVRPFRVRLRDTPHATTIADMVENTSGGLRLNVSGAVEIRSRAARRS